MLRADVFSDGRLLRVSPEARLLAVALEALAESTGMVRMDVDEVRSMCGFFLADAQGPCRRVRTYGGGATSSSMLAGRLSSQRAVCGCSTSRASGSVRRD
jgi:hypothetical protein